MRLNSFLVPFSPDQKIISKRLTFICLLFFLPFFLTISACDNNDAKPYEPQFSSVPLQVKTTYLFGIHPLHNPKRLFDVFQPLMDYLEENIPNTQFKLEASRNYAAYDKKLYAKKFHFSLPNPYQTINAVDKGYRVFAKMGDDDNFRGIILVRKDSNITQVSDLKGKAISYPAPTALAATMMPQQFIQDHGVNVMDELDNRYVGSQESSIMNVFLGDTYAASTWPPPWRALSKERPELAEQLEIKWQTKPLPNNGLVVRPDVPEDVFNQVKRLLVNLHTTSEGKKILKPMELSKFEVATDRTYQPVRDFVANFSQTVRPLK